MNAWYGWSMRFDAKERAPANLVVMRLVGATKARASNPACGNAGVGSTQMKIGR